MNKLQLVSILLFFVQFIVLAQIPELIDSNTTASARKKFRENIISNTIEKNLQLPLNRENEKHWMSAFWGMEFILYKNKDIESSIRKALNDYPNRTDEFNRTALEVAYTLYPNELIKEHEKILKQTSVPKHFAIAFSYLNRLKPSKYNQNHFEAFVRNNFQDWQDNPILFMLYSKLFYSHNNLPRPSLVDLFSHNFGEGKTILFSLQRKNRDYPGLLLIRKPDGKFLRIDNGYIFHVSQLARSINNLPGFLTNGNTPQGIFSIQGIDTSQNVFIGRTPNIQLVLPYEVDAKKFLHTNDNFEWDKNLYKSLLPVSWRNYTSIYEAFYAGKAGRNEIIAHGTTIDLDFYAGQPYYPHTPTLGCLCTVEIWSTEDGKRVYSDQAVLINEMKKLNTINGYLVVVEIDDKSSAVTLNDILPDVLHAEKFFVKLKE